MTAKKKDSAKHTVQRVSGITSAKDRSEALESIVRAFSNMHMETHMLRSLWRGTFGDPEHTRIAVADGRVVSAVVMGRRMIRFGSVAVPAMTVGPVGTHDHHRKQGYSFAAMNDASKHMEENGFLVAYLGGIPNYYNRYGYYPWGAGGGLEFGRDDAKKEALPGRLRAMKREDLPAVRRIYDKTTANRTCASVRDAELWDWLLRWGTKTWLFGSPSVILDANKRICGYFTGERKQGFSAGEIIVKQNEPSCRAALGALVREARRHEVKRIWLNIPCDDALAVFIRQYVGCEIKLHANATGGMLMKIVDFPALMRRLQPELTRRRQAAGRDLPKTQFTLATEIGAVGLAITRSGVEVGKPAGRARVRIPQRWLSGMFTGYHAIKDIAPRAGASIPSRLIPVMEALFPAGWPYVYKADSY
jgi:predicted acetyltransferase